MVSFELINFKPVWNKPTKNEPGLEQFSNEFVVSISYFIFLIIFLKVFPGLAKVIPLQWCFLFPLIPIGLLMALLWYFTCVHSRLI